MNIERSLVPLPSSQQGGLVTARSHLYSVSVVLLVFADILAVPPEYIPHHPYASPICDALTSLAYLLFLLHERAQGIHSSLYFQELTTLEHHNP